MRKVLWFWLITLAYVCCVEVILTVFYGSIPAILNIANVELLVGPPIIYAGYLNRVWNAIALYLIGAIVIILASSLLIPGENLSGGATSPSWYTPVIFLGYSSAFLVLLHLIPVALLYWVGRAVDLLALRNARK